MLGGEGCWGDALAMAMARGADTADMSYINGTFGVSLNRYPLTRVAPGDVPILRIALYKGAIAVNSEARRFADESISYKILGEKCLEQPGHFAFQVFDRKIMDQSQEAPNSNDFAGAQRAGWCMPRIRSAPWRSGLESTRLRSPTRLHAITLEWPRAAIRSSAGFRWGQGSVGRSRSIHLRSTSIRARLEYSPHTAGCG